MPKQSYIHFNINSYMVSSLPFIFHQNNKHLCYIIILLIFQKYFVIFLIILSIKTRYQFLCPYEF